MTIACHILEVVAAFEAAVSDAAKEWWHANGFTIDTTCSATDLSATRGSGFGITDPQTKRIMEVILKPVGESTAVSVYHHTSRLLNIIGVVFTDLLQTETDSFIRYIREHATTKR